MIGHAHGELADDRARVDRLEAERLARVVGAPQHQLGRARRRRACRATTGRSRRRARSAPATCRCCASPSRGGCAARASGASARSRAGPRRRRSRPRSGPASCGCGSRGRRRSRTTARRSRAGCRATGPRRRRCPRRSSPGGSRIAERQRVGRADDQRAGALARLDQRPEVLDRAEEVRLLDEDGGRVVVDRRGELVEVGRAGVVERRLDDLAAEPLRVGRERLARVRVDAARDHEPPAPVLELREVARPRRRTTGPRTSTRSRPAAPSAPRSRSGTRTSPAARPARSRAGTACTASGTPSA